MKTKIISMIQIIVLLVAIILLSTLIKPCSAEMTMKCNYSVSVVKLLFTTMIVMKGIEVFSKEHVHRYLDIITILLLVDSILILSWLIGGCKMADMACQAKTFPSIYIFSGALIILNLISIMLGKNNRKGEVKE